jgi:hypothetical protein
MCVVCGRPGKIHLTDIHNGVKTQRSFCMEHAPARDAERDAVRAAPDAGGGGAFLQKQMDVVDGQIADPTQRAEFKAEIEKLIADIEAGRRRMADPD